MIVMLGVLVLYGRNVHLAFFFFNDTATTEIYTLSLHDALPIFAAARTSTRSGIQIPSLTRVCSIVMREDRKSTRLNSSHLVISYAVFCLKKIIMRMYTSV